MKYSYEFKKQCVELYRQGKWPKTPEGVNTDRFHVQLFVGFGWKRLAAQKYCGIKSRTKYGLQKKNKN